MRLLPQFDIDTVGKVLAEDFPELTIQRIELIDTGWANLCAEINKELIFRFPKAQWAPFAVECNILSYLHGKLTLIIPQLEYIGKSYDYSGYRKIPGVHLTPEIYRMLSESQYRQLVSDIANFFVEIHRAIPLEVARRFCIPQQDMRKILANIQPILSKFDNDPVLKKFVADTCLRYEGMISDPVELVCIYSDLHGENIAFDPVAGRLNGVYDFGDLMIADVNREFTPLYVLDPTFMDDVLRQYQAATKRILNRERIELHARINALYEMTWLLENPESTDTLDSWNRILHWSSPAGEK